MSGQLRTIILSNQPYSNMAGSSRERALSERTLVCLLQAVKGYRTTVELRSESSAEGLIENVDGFMNVSMSDVKFSKQDGNEVKCMEFPTMFIQGQQIRYVQIPDCIDMRKAIEEQLTKLEKPKRANCGRRLKRSGKT